MTKPNQIEVLRQMALEEQHNSNFEGREPSRSMLDELGSTVLADFAPAMCLTPRAYYIDFKADKGGYHYEELEMTMPVVGSFGGFLSVKEELDFEEDGRVQINKIGYFIMNSGYKDTGYFCPVNTTTLVDVVSSLKPDNLFFNELASCIGSGDELDVDELVKITKLVRPKDPDFYLYSALVRSIITPSEVFKEATFNGCYVIDSDNEVASYNKGLMTSTIDKGDYLQLVPFGSPETQILLRKGRSHPLALSLSMLIGYERADSICD
ncbi:MAG: hypothetical protein WCJ60_02435 [bacterium]